MRLHRASLDKAPDLCQPAHRFMAKMQEHFDEHIQERVWSFPKEKTSYVFPALSCSLCATQLRIWYGSSISIRRPIYGVETKAAISEIEDHYGRMQRCRWCIPVVDNWCGVGVFQTLGAVSADVPSPTSMSTDIVLIRPFCVAVWHAQAYFCPAAVNIFKYELPPDDVSSNSLFL